ncbi:MAG: TIGR00269 family protein [Acidimicrobiia bacterium]|nr:TIGR00269 family protein [Acidimicrobiia bacterium]
MRCRVCRGRAAIEVRRHNAAFCGDHFVEHIQRQVQKTIDDLKMFQPTDRALLGVSGGKDSLALWDILTDLGYQVDGVNLELGIGTYSADSTNYSKDFADRRGLTLHEVDLESDYGFTIPMAADTSSRTPCSACGLSKRYVLNAIARRRGYNVLVMGHNLDDEAATLFSNVTNWNLDYLARQQPVLDETETGLARKVKPLIRVAERETAAYAVIRGIDYEIDECPMASGNTVNRIKEQLNAIEQTSPGMKQRFLFGFLERGAPVFREGRRPELTACTVCESPTTGDVCAFCKLQQRASGRSKQAQENA